MRCVTLKLTVLLGRRNRLFADEARVVDELQPYQTTVRRKDSAGSMRNAYAFASVPKCEWEASGQGQRSRRVYLRLYAKPSAQHGGPNTFLGSIT